MHIVVRQATADDAPALARLRWRWRVEERNDPTAIDRESFVDFFTTWTLDQLGHLVPFVAEADGRIAGMAWLSLNDRVPSPRALYRRAGDIQSVYVLPELRGERIGARLIEAVIGHARLVEVEYLTVHSAGTAIGFYEKLGFQHEPAWMAFPVTAP